MSWMRVDESSSFAMMVNIAEVGGTSVEMPVTPTYVTSPICLLGIVSMEMLLVLALWSLQQMGGTAEERSAVQASELMKVLFSAACSQATPDNMVR